MAVGFISKISDIVNDFGVRNALLYGTRRALQSLPLGVDVVKYLLVAQPVPKAPQTSRSHALNIVEVAQKDYDYNWFPRPPEFIDARFKQDAICFVAFSQNAAIACLWLKQGSYREDIIRALFRPVPEEHSIWDFDVYVQPDFRISRTFLHLWSHAFAWMRANDISWTMSRIDAFNQASIQAHQKLGAQVVDQIIFWRVGPFQACRSINAPNWIWSRTKIPEYEVYAPTSSPPANTGAPLL